MLLLSIADLTSCVVGKKVVYVNDMVADSAYHMNDLPLLRVQKNDRLNIVVSAKNPELAAPFNAGIGTYKVSDDGNISMGVDRSVNTQGYLIDQQGNVTFPVLGTLHLEGLTLDQVRDLLGNQLTEQQLLKDPIVKVEMLNFKISVMGAVNREMVMNIPDARITLLEALAQAGGLTKNAAPDKITVIREESGIRKRIVNNIESGEIFSSPAYYLQQNDIVYVEPQSAENTPREDRNWRFVTTAMGSITMLFTLLNFLK
jgi:polysaccharide export outer membrane protein